MEVEAAAIQSLNDVRIGVHSHNANARRGEGARGWQADVSKTEDADLLERQNDSRRSSEYAGNYKALVPVEFCGRSEIDKRSGLLELRARLCGKVLAV
jgi:hypothetical protein